MCLVVQVCGVAAAERAWKVFSFIHDRRRNRLTKDRAEKLVWLHYNLRIIDRVHNQEWEEVMHAIPDDDAAWGCCLGAEVTE